MNALSFYSLALFLASVWAAPQVQAREVEPGLSVRTMGGSYLLPVSSIKARRFSTVIPQQYDFSCGSAATATLLTFHYGHRVSEAEVFAAMYQAGNRPKIQKMGFSLGDIRRYLAGAGYSADGFKAGPEDLASLRQPALVLIDDRGYRHFVVVKGVKHGRVLLGDPAKGIRSMPLSQFTRSWSNGVLFLVRQPSYGAKFNDAQDWKLAPMAAFDAGAWRERGATQSRKGPGDI